MIDDSRYLTDAFITVRLTNNVLQDLSERPLVSKYVHQVLTIYKETANTLAPRTGGTGFNASLLYITFTSEMFA